jgi:hypothetical protein
MNGLLIPAAHFGIFSSLLLLFLNHTTHSPLRRLRATFSR